MKEKQRPTKKRKKKNEAQEMTSLYGCHEHPGMNPWRILPYDLQRYVDCSPAQREKGLMFMTSVSGAVRRGMTSLFLNNPVEFKKKKQKKLLCCCGSRAPVVGSWLMQSERNTTGFTSGPLWQEQKGWSQHLDPARCSGAKGKGVIG